MLRKRLLANKKGQSVVETALVLPIIILILVGIIDFGLMFNNYLVIANASREGARNAAVGSTDMEVFSIIANMTSTLNNAKMKITIYPSPSLRKKGEEIKVTVEYDNDLITPIMSSIIPNPLHLKSETVMRIE
ncbi:MAG: pilus assembly protein [Clostridia bacterium]|nr:pilus assembly protein [Clostridia bacterium]